MTLEELKDSLPDYAKDLRLNLESVLREGGAPGLDQKQIALVALASAISARHAPLTRVVTEFASEHAEPVELDGTRAAAAIMGMNNVYYRFTHSLSNQEYSTLRASLRMNIMARPGCNKTCFELAALAVSAINGCSACMDSHEKPCANTDWAHKRYKAQHVSQPSFTRQLSPWSNQRERPGKLLS